MTGKRIKTTIQIVAIIVALCMLFISPLYSRSNRLRWSKTTPEINLVHIFAGEINRRGRPTGFHSRPGGKDPATARVLAIKAQPNQSGVYTARVEIFDKREKRWKEKFSTMFPDSMSRQQVIDTILYAWKHRKKGKKPRWEGPSGKGFLIQGYTNRRGNINTAYPLYKR